LVASTPLDVLANANTLLGQGPVTIAIAALLASIAWRRGPRLGWVAVGLFVVVGAVGVALKVALDHPPPSEAFSRSFWNPLGVTIATPSSFPSGHVARVTFLAIFAATLVRVRPARIALAVLVAYTVWARVYIGDHWVSDAIGGLALGVAAGCGAVMWIDGRRGYDRRA
jgi:undecaprenyl-diphosphatase